jgi:hypothetical protein
MGILPVLNRQAGCLSHQSREARDRLDPGSESGVTNDRQSRVQRGTVPLMRLLSRVLWDFTPRNDRGSDVPLSDRRLTFSHSSAEKSGYIREALKNVVWRIRVLGNVRTRRGARENQGRRHAGIPGEKNVRLHAVSYHQTG